MIPLRTQYIISTACAIICILGTFLDPKNQIFPAFVIFNVWNMIFIRNLEAKIEKAKEKKVKVEDLKPND